MSHDDLKCIADYLMATHELWRGGMFSRLLVSGGPGGDRRLPGVPQLGR